MLRIKADLHIHTCLSPCGDLEMTPKRILHRAKELGLGLIAISDHNSCGNAAPAMRIGQRIGVVVLPALEITTKEEVHVLGIFKDLQAARNMEDLIKEGQEILNRPEIFGEQVLVNEEEELEGFIDRLLISATRLSLKEVSQEIHRLNGICVAAHVDKASYSILSQLGMLPQDVSIEAVEVWDVTAFLDLRQKDLGLEGLTPIRGSDAHYLEEIGKKYTTLLIEAPLFDELLLALKGERGRGVIALEGP